MKSTQNASYLAQLKDIKSVVEVPDSTLYIFIALSLLLLALILYGLYRYFTRVKRSKKLSEKELAYKRLKDIEGKSGKELLYSFSVDGSVFLNDANRAEFEAIERDLEPYKYKRESEEIPAELLERVKKFIKGAKYAK